jgi:hypothetical protein
MMHVRASGFVSDETGGFISLTPMPSTEAEVVAATAGALAGSDMTATPRRCLGRPERLQRRTTWRRLSL